MTVPLNQEKDIFEQAIEIESQTKRIEFVKSESGKDKALADRVFALLTAHEAEARFLPNKSEKKSTIWDDSLASEEVGSIIGRYKLLERIGEGGFGFVWAAEQREPVRRRVALKIIKLGMDTKQVVARFEAERQALALMDDPNISKILDAGATDTGRPYFVMELVKGIPITTYCNQQKLTTREKLDLFIKVCQAIQHAHQKGIIHRDIKPSNIMVTLHDGVPVPKVIDFGIAKATQQELTDKTIYTQYSQFIGTPAYMSPEQAEMSGLDIDTRSDIYSLGVLLYEMLTGSTPFETKELMQSGVDEMRRIIRETEPDRPSTRLSQTRAALAPGSASGPAPNFLPSMVDTDLDWITMKCLEKDRARRYDTANGLALDLERHLSNEPVIARPPSPAYKLRKAWRRNRVAFTGGAAIAIALISGVIIASFGLHRAETQFQVAKTAKEEAEFARHETEYNRYISQIKLASVSLAQGNRNTAQQALLDTLREHRDFEWRHLVNEAWPPTLDFTTETFLVRKPTRSAAEFWNGVSPKNIASSESENYGIFEGIAFNSSGSQVLTSGSDGTVHVWNWNPQKPRLKSAPYEVHNRNLIALALIQDDTRLVTGNTKGVTQLWNTLTDQQIWSHGFSYPDSESAKPVFALWSNPDNTYICVSYFGGGFGGVIDVLETETGRRISQFSNHDKVVTSLRFLKDGNRIISASQDGAVKVWDLETALETEPQKRTSYHSDKGISIQMISPDASYVATGGYDGKVILWNSQSDEPERHYPGKHQISNLIFSHDGSCLFVVEGDKLITVLEVPSLKELTFFNSPDPLLKAAISPNDDRIATTSYSGRSIWAPLQLKQDPIPTLSHAHDDLVIQAAYSNSGEQIVTVSYDKLVKVWDTATQGLITTFNQHTNELISANFSLDEQHVVSVSSHGKARVWNSDTGRPLFSQDVTTKRFSQSASPRLGPRDIILEWSVSFSSNPFTPDGSRLVTSNGKNMIVVNSLDGRNLRSLTGSSVGWPVLSPLGGLVAIITDRLDVINVWDIETGGKKFSLDGHDERVIWAEFSPNGERIVTGSMDRTAIVYDATTGKQIHRLIDHQGWVSSARFSPDGEQIATASSDRTAKIWSVTSGELLSTMKVKGDSHTVTNVEFNPNADIPRILTTSRDSIVRLWDPEAREAREILQITRDSKLLYATWSPSGHQILTCWQDGVVQLYSSVPEEDFVEITDPEEMRKLIDNWRSTEGNK